MTQVRKLPVLGSLFVLFFAAFWLDDLASQLLGCQCFFYAAF